MASFLIHSYQPKNKIHLERQHT